MCVCVCVCVEWLDHWTHNPRVAGHVKSKIHIREGTLPEEQELFFGDHKLKDDQTVERCGISSMDTLVLVKPTDESSIFVKSVTGEVHIVEYFPSKTVADVKAKIHDMRKILPKKSVFDLQWSHTGG